MFPATMSDTNNIQGDITLDFDNADKARERRKRRSSIFERNRTLANSAGLDSSNAMEVETSDKDWEERYMKEVKKEIDDWKCQTKSVKNEIDSLTKKMKNRESLTNLVPSQILSDTDKEFLKGSDIYKTYFQKIDSVIESFAIVDKLQQMTDNLISRSVERLESNFTAELKKLWEQANYDCNFNYSIIESAENGNVGNLPYPEPFLQDFSCM